jgi:hypothetical protein
LPSGCFSAKSTQAARNASWAEFGKVFTPPLDLSKCGAMGLWIYGDGKGELVNLQLANAPPRWGSADEHYVDVDFTGWRYVELLMRERDSDRHADYAWPYGGTSNVYRNPLIRDHIGRLSIWLNNLPPGDGAKVFLGPVKALPVGKAKFANPSLAVGDTKIVFPLTLESGQYIAVDSPTDCKLRDERGEVLQTITPQGTMPMLAPGKNKVTFSCDPPADGKPARVKVTVITQGDPLAPSPKP